MQAKITFSGCLVMGPAKSLLNVLFFMLFMFPG
jgi:hypothetical protein